jgi:hypothetical protein
MGFVYQFADYIMRYGIHTNTFLHESFYNFYSWCGSWQADHGSAIRCYEAEMTLKKFMP